MTIFEKTGIYLSIFIIMALLALIGFSKNGVLDYKALQQNKTAVNKQVDEVVFKNQKLFVKIGSLVVKGDSIASGIKSTESGIVTQITKNQIILRKGKHQKT